MIKRLFTNKLFIGIVGLLCLSVLIWFVGPLFAFAGSVPLESATSRLVLILISVLGWVGLTVFRNWRAGQANKAMIEGIVEQTDSSLAHEQQEEVAVLAERFREGVEVLKKNSSDGQMGIYELPWYIIIGPPGAGKTTALVNSGLKFPLADKFGKQALQGVGGTRNCDWWFTDEAVLIDTAGRYVTQDSSQAVDSQAWDGFLDLLKRYRKRRPINGAILAISILDIITQNPQERKNHSIALKRRLEELNAKLGMEIPVYVMITKCDLVAGFNEFFEDLGAQDREQVWGMTFPYHEDQEEPDYIAAFNSEYSQMLGRLNARVFSRMQSERDVQRSHSVYSFPQQMASLQSTISEFLEDVFAKTRFDARQGLRGIYFCSGVQEGRPIDRVLGTLTRTLGLSGDGSAMPGAQARSYFLTNLFRDVVFAEKGIAAVDKKLEKRRSILQKASYATAIVATIVVAFAWSTSFTRNELYLFDMRGELDKFMTLDDELIRPLREETELVPPLQHLKAATDTYAAIEGDVPWSMRMGLYQGDKLTRAAKAATNRYLNANLAPLVRDNVESVIRLSNDQPDLLYEGLKTYLMLGQPDKVVAEDVQFWMQMLWTSQLSDEDEQRVLLGAVDDLLEGGVQAQTIDQRLVDRARRSLRAMDEAELHYTVFRNSVLDAGEDAMLGLPQMIPRNQLGVFARRSGVPVQLGVPILFTKDGEKLFTDDQLPLLVDSIIKEGWVLDTDSSAAADRQDQLEEELLSLYYDDYARYWREWLVDLQIAPADSLDEAIEIMEVISGNRSPLKAVLLSVAENTTFEKLTIEGAASNTLAKLKQGRLKNLFQSENDSGAGELVESEPEDIVNDTFDDINYLVRKSETGVAPIETILNQFSEYYAELIDMRDTGSFSDGTSSAAAKRIRIESARQPEPMRSWMNQLLTQNRQAVWVETVAEVGGQVSSSLAPQCDAAIRNRFPIYANASTDVTLADFGKFFGHGGVMDQFYQQNLAAIVDNSSSPWRLKNAGSGGISDATLRSFEYAASIRNAFFPNGGNQLAVNFGLKPVYLDSNVTQVQLEFGDQKLRYRHGPARVQWFDWPNAGSANGLTVKFIDASGGLKVYQEQGEWAILRALRKTATSNRNADTMNIEFNVEGRKATFELIASSVQNPFNLPALRRFSCP